MKRKDNRGRRYQASLACRKIPRLDERKITKKKEREDYPYNIESS